jgi:protein-L-isoaspartate(D-aspartate) O-methyltransferase
MVAHYGLQPGARILDVGCGKGFLLYEFTQALPRCEVHGLDISEYALAKAKPEVRDRLLHGNCVALPWPDGHFDFVVSITTLHNLCNYELDPALREIERVRRGPAHITIESYRNEAEKANLLYWQLTCRAFHTPAEWQYLFDRAGYTGDYGAIYFE